MIAINHFPSVNQTSFGSPGYSIYNANATSSDEIQDTPLGQQSVNLNFAENLYAAQNSMLSGMPSTVGEPGLQQIAAGTPAMLDQAESYLGLNGNRDSHKLMEITGESDIDPSKSKWCAAFAVNLMNDNKVLNTEGLENFNYTPTIKEWAQEKGIYKDPDDYTPKPGDAIMFDWDKNGKKVDHIGLVKEVKDGMVTTIEGNKDNAVGERTISLDNKNIDGYVVSDDVNDPTKPQPSAVDPKESNAAQAAAAKSAVSAQDPKSSNAASAAAKTASDKPTVSSQDPKSSNAASAAARSTSEKSSTSHESSKSSGSGGGSSSSSGSKK
jgi:hypothetical protein